MICGERDHADGLRYLNTMGLRKSDLNDETIKLKAYNKARHCMR